jgi:hypothetical protein
MEQYPRSLSVIFILAAGKVKLSRYAIQAPRGKEVQLLILEPGTRWGEW